MVEQRTVLTNGGNQGREDAQQPVRMLQRRIVRQAYGKQEKCIVLHTLFYCQKRQERRSLQDRKAGENSSYSPYGLRGLVRPARDSPGKRIEWKFLVRTNLGNDFCRLDGIPIG